MYVSPYICREDEQQLAQMNATVRCIWRRSCTCTFTSMYVHWHLKSRVKISTMKSYLQTQHASLHRRCPTQAGYKSVTNKGLLNTSI